MDALLCDFCNLFVTMRNTKENKPCSNVSDTRRKGRKKTFSPKRKINRERERERKLAFLSSIYCREIDRLRVCWRERIGESVGSISRDPIDQWGDSPLGAPRGQVQGLRARTVYVCVCVGKGGATGSLGAKNTSGG